VLTADLIQARVKRGFVEPFYIDASHADSLQLAKALIEMFQAHGGKPRRELDAQLRDYRGSGTGFLLHRGLAKLLEDRSEFGTVAALEPPDLRRAVFETAAAAHRNSAAAPVDRAAVFQKVSEDLQLPVEACEGSLYADLKEEQLLEKFKVCTPQWLLNRYNLALAQAVLLRATALEVELPRQKPSRYRQLFHRMKFCQLLYQVEGSAKAGYRFRLDGPLSLFKSSQRYGLQMANFLPALLHCEGWKLEADVLWGKQRREKKFRLTAKAGLEPPNPVRGRWQPEEMRWMQEQFGKLKSVWELATKAELVDLGGRGVLVPDYVFTHSASGRRVLMEVFGFWRRGAIDSRLALLREHGPENLILALGKGLNVGEEALEDVPGEVYLFRQAPIAREVLKRLEGFLKS